MLLKKLVGSGDKIGLFSLPFIVIGIVLNLLRPDWFAVGGPSKELFIISIIVLIPGIINWAWSVILILSEIPKKKLITTGPFTIVKHPLYTGVAFLVLPWLGFLFNSWIGMVIGLSFYIGRLIFAPAEEKILLQEFGEEWKSYSKKVFLPWL